MENTVPLISPLPVEFPTDEPQEISSQPGKIPKNTWLLAGGLGLLLMVGILSYFLGQNKVATPDPAAPGEPVACTMEAKICPDGSAVGRSGPNCEFAECPSASETEKTSWLKYTNTKYGYSIEYPDTWQLQNVMGGEVDGLALAESRAITITDKSTLTQNQPAAVYIEEIQAPVINKTEVERINGLDFIVDEWGAYYLYLPEQKTYLNFAGVSGKIPQASSNKTAQEIFATFRLTQ